MKKRIILLSALSLLGSLAMAQETPLWIRRNAISPDGQTLAFSYKGDIWTVPVSGGQARQLTSHRAHETDPLWSPDGKVLVFTSQREGSKDLYVTTPEGGVPKRLTTLPGT